VRLPVRLPLRLPVRRKVHVRRALRRLTTTGAVPAGIVAAASAALALVGVVRLALVPPAGRDVELARIGMAGGMVAMALPPPALPWWPWPAVVLAGCAWSAARLRAADPHRTHRLHHVGAGLAMAYLLVLAHLPGPSPMAGHHMPGTGPPVLSALLLAADLVVLGYAGGSAALAALSLVPLRPATLPPQSPAPRASAACQLVMSLLMLDMVVAMLR
jgi:hypothetical protein